MKKQNKILMFLADPSDILSARQTLRVTEEEEVSVCLLEEVTSVEAVYDRYYFQSSGDIINFYRGEY